MNLNRRIEALEKQSPPDVKKRIFIWPVVGKTAEEAWRRYCEDNGLELDKLDNGDYGQVCQIRLVKTGCLFEYQNN
jgi:hypothetical protein